VYHRLRALHRWVGLIGSIFLIVISATGFLLATKGSIGWIRPAEKDGTEISSLAEVVSNHQAAEAAFALGIPELQTMAHIDRIDYRPKSNVFKVVSKEGYHEVQVDGKTGKVVNKAYRLDQLSEDIHDMSFFHDSLNTYWLPVVALLLLTLGITGVYIFFVPVWRRWKFAKSRKSPPLA
jgi:uncharacterized iron-regulated membrane protein